MVDLNVVAMKLGELADRIGRIRSHCPGNPEDLATDLDALDIVSFNLLLAVQVCLDLASHLISDEGLAAGLDGAGRYRAPRGARSHLPGDSSLSPRRDRAAQHRRAWVLGRGPSADPCRRHRRNG